MTTLPIPWAVERARFICDQIGASFDQLSGRAPMDHQIRGRQIVAVLLRDYAGPGFACLSFPEITVSTGRSNHSSVITQYRMAKEDRAVMAEVEALADRFGWKKHKAAHAAGVKA